jgi:hypothetical protein
MRNVVQAGPSAVARWGTVLAMTSALALVGVPAASAQLSGGFITNSGQAAANSGGNDSTGNSSTNNVGTGDSAAQGGLLGLGLNVGGSNNNSTGSSTVNTGGANAGGNQSASAVNQGAGSGHGFGPAFQSAGVSNAGRATANSGGNTSTGNASLNNVGTGDQTAQGGLIGAAVNLGGSNNNSTGSSNVNTGTANAGGNQSSTLVNQGAGDGHGCFGGVQQALVGNHGEAAANSGGNASVGNNSVNNVGGGSQTAQGGLIGLGVNLGGPNNISNGTSNVTTGEANAAGNDSGTIVNQGCGEAGAKHAFLPPVALRPVPLTPPSSFFVHGTKTGGSLARTGSGTSDLVMVAGALLLTGMVFTMSARRARRVSPASASASADVAPADWDSVVRW